MSINSMMKTYEVYEKKQLDDEWGADTNEEVKVGEAQVTINYKDASRLGTDNKYSEVTHMGLTLNKGLKQGQVLVLGSERYVIYLPPNNVARYTQLYLKAVE